jgi:hypothetical protein
MPNRSTLDSLLQSTYIPEAAVTNPQTVVPGFDNLGCDAVTYLIAVKTGAAALATIWESDDNITFTVPADPNVVIAPSGPGGTVSLAVANTILMLAYVGNKRYTAVRTSGGTPTISVIAIGELQNITDRAKTL